MTKVFIIAEAGVNHNGSLDVAKKMVDAAAAAGADAVKFQTFKAEDLVRRTAPKASYQKKATHKGETQYQMLKKLELDRGAHRQLLAHCQKRKIMFLSTPFDAGSLEFLMELGLGTIKIPSGEITNLPYLRKAGALKKKVILSTGMSDLNEVRRALGILTRAGTPKADIVVLHCNTEYPTPYKDVNLRAMLAIRDDCRVKVGYSDHTLGIEVPIAAVALGAVVIEKHFTLDRNMAGPDHKASLEPQELCKMVRTIRHTQEILGSPIKKPTSSELANKWVARKSIVAIKGISKGEIFSRANIGVKRPGSGLSPMLWDKILGKASKYDFLTDDFIRL